MSSLEEEEGEEEEGIPSDDNLCVRMLHLCLGNSGVDDLTGHICIS